MAANLDNILIQLPLRNRPRVRNDILNLMANIKSLVPQAGSLVHNDGRVSKVVSLNGTVPINFQNAIYNIPVESCILDSYPDAAPQLFVRPTSNMVVKHNHQHVDSNGCIYLPYLHEWNPTTSNLVDLFHHVKRVFSAEPPLYSRPVNDTPKRIQSQPAAVTTTASILPSPNTPPVYNTSGLQISSSSSISASMNYSHPQVTQPPQMYSSVAYQPPPSYSSSSNTNYANAQYNVTSSNVSSQGGSGIQNSATSVYIAQNEKVRLYNEVADILNAKIISQNSRFRDEIEMELQRQVDLSERKTSSAESARSLRTLRDKLQLSISQVEKQSAELEVWKTQKDAETLTGTVDLEDYLQPFDPCSAQLTSLCAENNAYEDAFYYLERALASKENESVNLFTFLQESRKMARKQFLCKYHTRKIQQVVASTIGGSSTMAYSR